MTLLRFMMSLRADDGYRIGSSARSAIMMTRSVEIMRRKTPQSSHL